MNQPPERRPDRSGYALLTVCVFSFVVLISGMALFAMASHESRQAAYREESAEAFALADGAIERARARFLSDRLWTAGYDTVAGRGAYALTVEHMPYVDPLGETHPYTVRLLATGTVGRATRRVEVWSGLPLTASGLMFLIVGDMAIRGNMNIHGGASHINGAASFGPNDVHLKEGEYTTGFEVEPPIAQTAPEYYPDATYYRVRAARPAGHPLHARVEVYDRATGSYIDLSTTLGDSLRGVITASGGNVHYNFDGPLTLTHYFDQDTGIFRRFGGTAHVVVNFGEPPLAPLDAVTVSNLDFKGQNAFSMRSTIINTRRWNDAAPLQSSSWEGGLTTVRLMDMEPTYGLGLLVHDFMTNGMSNCYMGTPDWPSLTYVTGNVVDLTANGEFWGSIIVLGNWGDLSNPTTGGPSLHFDPAFLAHLPGYLGEGWDVVGSGTMRVLSWREVAVTD